MNLRKTQIQRIIVLVLVFMLGSAYYVSPFIADLLYPEMRKAESNEECMIVSVGPHGETDRPINKKWSGLYRSLKMPSTNTKSANILNRFEHSSVEVNGKCELRIDEKSFKKSI